MLQSKIEGTRLKRKIAVILAADIAGYSRLIAEDEEETLRRFEGYRAVFTEFVERSGGRIFNTAGDAILAEFQSAVEAVRCAVDIQESLRARNLAYPASRHMSFRIGITIGDVVERDGGDLLGDGVNIAARLESVAPPGGICVSRSVYEAVAKKMTVSFADAGPQELKNIPERVHAYTLSLDEENAPAAVTLGNEAKPAKAPPTPATSETQQTSWLTLTLAVLAFAVAGAYIYEYVYRPEPEKAEQTTSAPSGTLATPDTPDSVSPSGPQHSEATPEPEKETETAVHTPEIDRLRAPPNPLASRYVLTRQWKDCHDSTDPEISGDACRRLLDSSGLSSSDEATIRHQFARALRDQGQTDEAIKSYTRAIELKPTPDTYQHRAIAYFDKGDYTRAIEDFDEAVRLKPSFAEAINNRAWTYYKAGDLKKALSDANRAVQLDGSKAYIWDTRAHIHEAQGSRNAAISDYRKALELDSESQSSRDGLERLGAN